MDEPYIGEIRLFAGEYAPPGWVLCDGRELPIDARYAALYDVIGRAYGGGPDGFAVPDLLGGAPGAPIPPGAVSFIIAAAGRPPRKRPAERP